MTRKLVLNLVVSLDGFIADKNGKFDWIKGEGDKSNDTKKQFNFQVFIDSVDTIVMGRNAYEDCPKETMESFKSKRIFVATSKDLEIKYGNVEFINEDIVGVISKLKGQEGKSIWLFGGGKLTDSFLKSDIIDEFIIGIIPIILGDGRPLFFENNPFLKLHLEEYTVQEGIVILKYTKRK